MTTNLEEKRKWKQKRMKRQALLYEYPSKKHIENASIVLTCIGLACILTIILIIIN
jgi:hypothetical protein